MGRAAAAKTGHCLHELRGRAGLTIRTAHGAGRGIGRQTPELPIQSDLPQAGGSGQLIV
jgi:hypothetical protein